MKLHVKYLKIFCNLAVAVMTVVLLFYALPRILAYFLPFVIGFVLSLIANPVVKFLEKKIKIKRKYGSALMIILVIGAIVLVCYGLFSLLLNGLFSFAQYFPTMYHEAEKELVMAAEQAEKFLNQIPFWKDFKISGMGESIEDFLNGLMPEFGQPTVLAIGGFAKNIPNMLVGLVIGLLATYYFIADKERMHAAVERYVPKSFQERISYIYGKLMMVVGGYFKAQFKIMLIIYVVVLVGLLLIDVRYAWLIGFGIAFLDMLPVFGTGTVLCPWAVVKLFTGDYQMAAGLLVLYVLTLTIHQLIQPKLVGDSVGMDPFSTLVFMYIGFKINGVIGMILAIPIGMILGNLYEAGVFDTLIWCVREIVDDFNRFRRVNTDKKE